jgi:hypothetical protein
MIISMMADISASIGGRTVKRWVNDMDVDGMLITAILVVVYSSGLIGK